MAALWIGNIAPDTTDEELKAFLEKYGFPAFDAIERMPGDGSRPAAVLRFDTTPALALRQLQSRVHNLFWKQRRLNVEVVSGSGWDK